MKDFKIPASCKVRVSPGPVHRRQSAPAESMEGRLAHYRIQGKIGGATVVSLDQIIIADSDQMAIELAKGYPVMPGEGYADWARLTSRSAAFICTFA